MTNRFLLLSFILIISFNSYSQILLEKGYFINESGEKTECLIKNIDWKNNPNEFQYQKSEDGELKTASIEFIREFGINNASKYIRFKGDIDRSSEKIGKLSSVRSPSFQEEQLFLKVLVEGRASLFYYEDANLRRYFFQVDDSEIKQLVYKSYRTSGDRIGKNEAYKQQLWNNLKCHDFSLKTVEGVDYKKTEMVKFFTRYNQCVDSKFVNYEEKKNQDLFNLNIRPGVNYSSLAIHNSFSNPRDFEFSNEVTFRFGVEAEFIMPFNKNKWSLIVEPTYQYYQSETEVNGLAVEADYKSIEVPLGVRHYFFLKENSKIFINVSYIIDFTSNSVIERESRSNLDVKSRSNLAFGLGYNKNKYTVEARYGLGREVLSDYTAWTSDYKTLSVIFGYSLF